MSNQPAHDFQPYRQYADSEREAHDFVTLTRIAYGLAQQLLFANPRSALPPLPNLSLVGSKLSYCDADLELVCEWLTVDQYAHMERLDPASVQGRLNAGKLGHVRVDDTGIERVIWPPNMAFAPEEELPRLGKKQFKLQVGIPFELDLKDSAELESTQAVFLRLAHAIGEPEQASKRADGMLLRSGILLQWTVFEVFLRETVIELMRRFPVKLASGRRAKQTITYEDLVAKSAQLGSLDALTDHLVQLELESMRSGGKSVHGIINFLKDEFRFDSNPYKASYRFEGERRTASYSALMDLKHRRNALVHESDLDALETANKSGADIKEISENDYSEARLILRSIAFSIASSVARGEFRPT